MSFINKNIFVLAIILTGLVASAIDSKLRVQRMFLNKKNTQKIYLVPGMASSVHMPCEIDEIVTPTSGIMKHISDRNRTRFSLEVASGSRSTNFIVHCVSSSYVFDLVVNNKIHNDLIEVDGDYGTPRLTQAPPRMDRPSFTFKKTDGSVVGTKKDGTKVLLERYELSEKLNKKFGSIKGSDLSFDYSSLPKTKVFDSKDKGDSDNDY